MGKNSRLKLHPKSKIIERGYLHVYSQLNQKERQILEYQRKYKELCPEWDQTNIILCRQFEMATKGLKKVTVLDAGCGNGNYVIDEFRSQIDWAAGVDADTMSTRNNICLDEIKYSNLENIPYPDNEFDIVISAWVAEHLKNPEKVFHEIFRVLKKGGTLIMVTPNAHCWLVGLKKILGNGWINKSVNKLIYGRKNIDVFPTFYRFNDAKNIKKMLTGIGYQKIAITLNYDPGYTSFNQISFRISYWKQKLWGKLFPELRNQHLIVTASK